MEAIAMFTPNSRPRDDPHPSESAHIQDAIRQENRLRRQWQMTWDPALKAEVNNLEWSVTHQLNECRKVQWSSKLETLDSVDQSL
jgi:hypothetical protein